MLRSKAKSDYKTNMFAGEGQAGELGKKIFIGLLFLIVYRIGTYIPLPGVDLVVLDNIVKSQSNGILGMFNVLTGGALGRMSIFALNIMPYITASILIQLFTAISKDFNELKKSGESGREKINQYSRYLTVILALVQGYGIAVGIEEMGSQSARLVNNPGIYFRVITMFSLMGGTVFVMWLSEQITLRGIGNGSSLIIFTGIISGILPAISTILEMGRTNVLSTHFIILCILILIALVVFIVFMEKAQRKILVQYPRKLVGNKMFKGDSTHLPIKINIAGVIPPIFASSLLLFPTTIIGFLNNATGGEVGFWHKFIANHLSHGKLLYIILYAALIMFFSFFYTSIVFNSEETAENLRKNGAIIIGRRPGKQTAEYLEYIIIRLTVIGSLYIATICIIPEFLISEYSVPFYLGGTSLLIVVNVVIDLFTQIQSHLLSNKYMHLMKKNRIIGR